MDDDTMESFFAKGFHQLSEVSVVTQKASFTILAIKMHNASALYAET